MKNETYRRAFDNLNVPDDMAARIRRAAERENDSAPRRENAVAPAEFPRRKPGRRWRAAVAACACAAALGLLVWKSGLLPRRADKAAGSDSGVNGSESVQNGAVSESGGAQKSAGEEPSAGSSAGKSAEKSQGASAAQGASAEAGGKAAAKAADAAPKKFTSKPAAKDAAAPSGDKELAAAQPDSSGESTLNPNAAPPPDNAVSAGAANPGTAQVVNPVQTVSAPADLAAQLPFTPALPAAVPDGWRVLSCAVIGGELAQIVYTDGAGEVCWRTAQGASDVSGDCTDYAETSVRGGVTLRGENGTVGAAWWTADGMAFSLTFSPAVSGDDALAWALAVKG